MKLAIPAALAAALFSAASLTASAQSGTSATGDQPSMNMEKCDPGSPNCKAGQRGDKPYSSETTGSVKSNDNSAAGDAQDDAPNKDCPPGLAKKKMNPSEGRDTTGC
ncbi:hypothetical protein GGE07_001263 [Sinorhizobium terangae]|uniref:Uncharacterized protein n=1 Tax=Sinorhizobium terangae TaxID=110322 RepID=A0A6N7LFX8_SINTE|nr:hypothetical protein [Sinorhizobium terangae]MBB4184637.1 hypothetical protein [Sinorhizobium terangae]MQX16506.1 hypothetical protein [Sinorhizobium terangae]